MTHDQGELPPWKSVLAVVAHPDDESFGLGAVITAFIENVARVDVLQPHHIGNIGISRRHLSPWFGDPWFGNLWFVGLRPSGT